MSEFNILVERELDALFDQQRLYFQKLSPRSVRLIEYVKQAAHSGGKRLRPLFCFLGHIVSGGEDATPIIRAASSLELLHIFAIIHDDLMDASDERRGKPSLHKAIAAELGSEGIGTSLALLAGDLAFSLSKQLFEESGFNNALLSAARQQIWEIERSLAAGQYLDLVSSPWDGPEALTDAARLKTASYTVCGPLLVGATLAGATREITDPLSDYGLALGEAFQLRDDLDAVFSDKATETMTSNVVIAKGISLEPSAASLYERLLDGDSSALVEVSQRLRESGAAEYIETRIRDLASLALLALNQRFPPPVTNEQKSALEALADVVPIMISTT